MAKCEICSKEVNFGNNVSHSNRKTSRTYKPNVQSVKVNEKRLLWNDRKEKFVLKAENKNIIYHCITTLTIQ